MSAERVALSGTRHAWALSVEPARLRRMTEAMLEEAGETGRVELRLVRDGEMAALNARHLGCAGPTNVLAFPESAPPVEVSDEAFGLLGSLVLSVDAVHREALLYGQDEGEHCLRLLAHGLAHVLGYDHGPVMERLCARLLRACAV